MAVKARSGQPWKFVVMGQSADGAELQAAAALVNFTPRMTDAILELLGHAPPEQSVATVMYVVVLPGGDLQFFVFGAIHKRGANTFPIIRTFEGDINRGAREVLQLCQAADQ